MEAMNLLIGWVTVLGGLVAGAVIGMFFDRVDWLGGYGSWRRRMVRLTHISMVGTGLLNLAYALSVHTIQPGKGSVLSSVLFAAGGITMPLVCGLAAWRGAFRHLFFIPVLSLIIASADFIYRGLLS